MVEADPLATQFRRIARTLPTLSLMDRALYLSRVGDVLIRKLAQKYDRESRQTTSAPNRKAVDEIYDSDIRLARDDFYYRMVNSVHQRTPVWQTFEARPGQLSDDAAHPFFICGVLGIRIEEPAKFSLDEAFFTRRAVRRKHIMSAIEEARIDESLVTAEKLSALLRKSLARELAVLGRLVGVPERRAIAAPARGREQEFWKEHLTGRDQWPGIYSSRAYTAQMMVQLAELLTSLETRMGISGDQLLLELLTIERMEAERLGTIPAKLLRRGLYSLLDSDPLEADILLAALAKRLPALFVPAARERLEQVAVENSEAVDDVLALRTAELPFDAPRELAAYALRRAERAPEARKAYAASLRGHILITGDRNFQYVQPGAGWETFKVIPFRWNEDGTFSAYWESTQNLNEFMKRVRKFDAVELKAILEAQADIQSPHGGWMQAIAADPWALYRAAEKKGNQFVYPAGVDLPEPPEAPPPPLLDSVQLLAIGDATRMMLHAARLSRRTPDRPPDHAAAEIQVAQAVALLVSRHVMTATAVETIERDAGSQMQAGLEEAIRKRRAKPPRGVDLDEADRKSRDIYLRQRAQTTSFIRSELSARLPASEQEQLREGDSRPDDENGSDGPGSGRGGVGRRDPRPPRPGAPGRAARREVVPQDRVVTTDTLRTRNRTVTEPAEPEARDQPAPSRPDYHPATRPDPATSGTQPTKAKPASSRSARHSRQGSGHPASVSPRQRVSARVRRDNVQPDHDQAPSDRPGRSHSARDTAQHQVVHPEPGTADQQEIAPGGRQPIAQPPDGAGPPSHEGLVPAREMVPQRG